MNQTLHRLYSLRTVTICSEKYFMGTYKFFHKIFFEVNKKKCLSDCRKQLLSV